MSSTAVEAAPRAPEGRPPWVAGGMLPLVARYALAVAMVAAATLVAEAVQSAVGAPNLTLIYVLPVVVAASAFGWGPAILAVALGALAFDFFFTQPYYSLEIDRPSDIWSAVLLLVIAALVSAVATEARRRALEARVAAGQAEAIQGLAHAIIENRPEGEVTQKAAEALHRIFEAPAVVLMRDARGFRLAGGAGVPAMTAAEDEAARWALSSGLHTHANNYPFDESRFDFWPVGALPERRCVVGVDFTRAAGERPASPGRLVEVVAGYLAVALGR